MQHSCHRTDRGAAAVEFALVVPLLLALVFSIVDLGFAINRYTVLNNATREGVRAASLSQSAVEIEDAIEASLADMSGNVDVDVQCVDATGASCVTWDAGHQSGGTALVTVTYAHGWLTPMGKAVSEKLQLTKTSRMRIE